MPITEFVTPLLKHDAASIAFFQSTLFPTLSSTFASAPGFRLFALGHMIEENGISTSGAFKPVLGLCEYLQFTNSLSPEINSIQTTDHNH